MKKDNSLTSPSPSPVSSVRQCVLPSHGPSGPHAARPVAEDGATARPCTSSSASRLSCVPSIASRRQCARPPANSTPPSMGDQVSIIIL